MAETGILLKLARFATTDPSVEPPEQYYDYEKGDLVSNLK